MLHAAAEQVAAGGLHAVRAVAQVDRVEVQLEDLLLGERALQEGGDAELDELALQRAVGIRKAAGQVRVARHLHGDGAEALAHAQRRHVAHGGAHHAAPVHALVLVEAAVLHRQERLLHLRRDGAQGDVDASDGLHLPQLAPTAVQDAATLGRMVGADLLGRGTPVEATGGQPAIEGEPRDDEHRHQGESLPLATRPAGIGPQPIATQPARPGRHARGARAGARRLPALGRGAARVVRGLAREVHLHAHTTPT